jgi:arginase
MRGPRSADRSDTAADLPMSKKVGTRPGLGLLGVPSSAGSHNSGQEKAPSALRAAGLVEQLEARGAHVCDYGDLPVHRHRPAPRVNGVRDLRRVCEVINETAARVERIRAADRTPLVLGGDCTTTLGVLAGLAGHKETGLVYVDGDSDLNTPEGSGSGVLDTMGMTHLLGNGAPELAQIGPRFPLVRPEHVVLYGFDPGELNTAQWTSLCTQQLRAFPAPAVRQNPLATAAEACAHLESRVVSVLIHLDVDVLDTGAFPLANYPHFAGLSLPQLQQALSRLCASPTFGGLVLTEINPDHDPDTNLTHQVVEMLAQALAPTLPTDD